MSMTDPIADMLTESATRIMSRKAQVQMPSSRLKVHIAEILKDEGFITDYREIESGGVTSNVLQIELKWTAGQPLRHRGPAARLQARAAPLRRARTTSRRSAAAWASAILTTSRGRDDRPRGPQAGVGGEIICEVW